MTTIDDHVVHEVEAHVRKLCAQSKERLLFHGWDHISFVRDNAVKFAEANGAEARLVELAALVHDLNYVVEANSSAAHGKAIRDEILREVGLGAGARAEVETVVRQAETARRDANVSLAAQALSDADTLYKSLPITPVLLSKRYMDENGLTIRELGEKILREQEPLEAAGIYFYNTEAAKKYREWSRVNLELWRCIVESLDDPSVGALADRLQR